MVSLCPSDVKVLCKAAIPISPTDFPRMVFLRNQTRTSSRIKKSILSLNVPNMFKVNVWYSSTLGARQKVIHT